MPTFEEWCKPRALNALNPFWNTLREAYDAGFDAGTEHGIFEANSKLGDEGNEAEKVARRTVALRELLDCFTHIRPWNGEVLDAIIAKAQG